MFISESVYMTQYWDNGWPRGGRPWSMSSPLPSTSSPTDTSTTILPIQPTTCRYNTGILNNSNSNSSRASQHSQVIRVFFLITSLNSFFYWFIKYLYYSTVYTMQFISYTVQRQINKTHFSTQKTGIFKIIPFSCCLHCWMRKPIWFNE